MEGSTKLPRYAVLTDLATNVSVVRDLAEEKARGILETSLDMDTHTLGQIVSFSQDAFSTEHGALLNNISNIFHWTK